MHARSTWLRQCRRVQYNPPQYIPGECIKCYAVRLLQMYCGIPPCLSIYLAGTIQNKRTVEEIIYINILSPFFRCESLKNDGIKGLPQPKPLLYFFSLSTGRLYHCWLIRIIRLTQHHRKKWGWILRETLKRKSSYLSTFFLLGINTMCRFSPVLRPRPLSSHRIDLGHHNR